MRGKSSSRRNGVPFCLTIRFHGDRVASDRADCRAGTAPSCRPVGQIVAKGLRVLAISVGLILFSGEAAHATSFSWNVSTGDWFTATNWNPNGVPGSADDAVISNGGTCTLDGAASVTNFTLSNGRLSGTGTLTVSGTISWSGGDMVGGGTTTANGPLSISGAGLKVLARTLNSNTSATWTGSGNITMDTSALNIAAGTTFDVQNDQSVTINGGTPAINNAGTFQKSAGTGTTTVYGGVA